MSTWRKKKQDQEEQLPVLVSGDQQISPWQPLPPILRIIAMMAKAEIG